MAGNCWKGWELAAKRRKREKGPTGMMVSGLACCPNCLPTAYPLLLGTLYCTEMAVRNVPPVA